ncbi:hypothetical protein VPH35_012448 [Triticum aestivum]
MSTAKPLPRGQSRRPRPPPPRRRGGLAALATPIWRTQPRSGGRDLAAMVMGVASLLPPLAGAHRRGPGLARLPRTEARRSIAQQQAHRPRPTHGDLSNSGQDGRGQVPPVPGRREGPADADGGASQDLPHEAQVSATRGEDCFAISTYPIHQRQHLRGRLRVLFWQLGAMLSELFTNWTIYTNKAATLVTLLFVIAVNLAISILPHMMRPAPWSTSRACSPPPASRSQRA